MDKKKTTAIFWKEMLTFFKLFPLLLVHLAYETTNSIIQKRLKIWVNLVLANQIQEVEINF